MINLAVPKGKYLLLQSVYDYSLVLTAILAAWCVWYTKDIMRVFCILILIILCSELIGVYMVKVAKLESNYLVYNIFNPIEFIILICSVFYYKIDDKKHILRGLVLTVYLIILGTTTYHFGGIALKFNNIAYISGGLLLVAIFIFALYKLTEETDKSLYKLPEFWLYLSIIISYGCMIPFYGLINYLLKTNYPLAQTISKVIMILPMLRYSFTIIGLGLTLPYFKNNE